MADTPTIQQALCSIEDCDRPFSARGWCKWHYERWRRHGDPCPADIKIMNHAERLRAQMSPRGPDECWPWQGTVGVNGYGIFTRGGDHFLAHRIVYESLVGPIPTDDEAGYRVTIDHTCHNADGACDGGNSCPHRACVNPDHLEVVSHRENVRRGRAGGVRVRRKAS